MNLAEVLARAGVWRAGGQSPSFADGIPTGIAALDERLPGGGWPRGALTEILAAREGMGALRLLAPALAAWSRAERWLVFVSPPYLPYPPALAAFDIDLDRVLLVREPDRKRMLWALEQALRSGACGAVLGWLAQADMPVLRRLQLAAAAGAALGFLFRPQAAARTASPAALRLLIDATPAHTTVQLLKCRGAAPTAPIPVTLPCTPTPPARHTPLPHLQPGL